jgi:hypothetical protein
MSQHESLAGRQVDVKQKEIHNLFAPDLPSSCQIASDLKQQYENYTNINKNVNAILNKVIERFLGRGKKLVHFKVNRFFIFLSRVG